MALIPLPFLLRFPVVSVGIIRWVECVVSEPNFFSLSTDYCRPVQLALLDEVVTCHPLLHSKVPKKDRKRQNALLSCGQYTFTVFKCMSTVAD